MKIGFCNKYLWIRVRGRLSYVWGLISILLTFWDINVACKHLLFYIAIVLSCVLYVSEFFFANFKFSSSLKIRNTRINIRKGDILSDKIYKNHEKIKVFNFNEYFDTQVDDGVIAEKSLNGQFLRKEQANVKQLDSKIKNDLSLNKQKIEENISRTAGKTIRYPLGAVYKYRDDILLTALTHFDENNRAYLSIEDYIDFLFHFWDEVDIHYANKDIVFTLFGSGITRIDNQYIDKTKLLNIILWTMKVKNVNFKKVDILLDEETSKEINYYEIGAEFDGL